MKIRVSGILRRYTDYREQLAFPHVETVGAGLDAFLSECPALRPVLIDGEDRIRTAHVLFLNGAQIGREQLGQTVSAADELSIVTAIAGG